MDIDTTISNLRNMRDVYGDLKVYTEEYIEENSKDEYSRIRVLHDAKVDLSQDENGEYYIVIH